MKLSRRWFSPPHNVRIDSSRCSWQLGSLKCSTL